MEVIAPTEDETGPWYSDYSVCQIRCFPGPPGWVWNSGKGGSWTGGVAGPFPKGTGKSWQVLSKVGTRSGLYFKKTWLWCA